MTLGLGRAALVRVPVDERLPVRADALESAIAADRRGRAVDRSPSWRPSARRRRPRSTRSRPSPTSPSARACGCTSTRRTPGRSRCSRSVVRRSTGWERADSIVINPHKWLFTPLDASLLLTRRMPVLRDAFSLVPEYLRTLDRETPVHDYNEYTPQLGRRFRALKLWMQLRWFGLDGLRSADRGTPRDGRSVRRLGRRRPATGSGWRRSRSRRSASAGTPAGGATRRELDAAQRGDHGRGQPHRRGLPVAHPARRAGSRSASRSATCARSRRHVERAWALLRAAAATAHEPDPDATRRPVLRLDRRAARLVRREPRRPPTELWLGLLPQGDRPADRVLVGGRRRGAVRRLDRQRALPRRRRSAAPSASRRGARAATGARSTWPRSRRSPSRAGCVRPGSPPTRPATPERTGDLLVRTGRGGVHRRRDRPLPGAMRPPGPTGSDARPSYRKTATHWVTSAKRPETRERRLVDADRRLAAGRKPRALTPTGRDDEARPSQTALDEAIDAARRARPRRRLRPAGGGGHRRRRAAPLCVPSDVGGLGGLDGRGRRGPRWRSGRSMARRRSGSRCRSTSTGALRDGDAGPDARPRARLPGRSSTTAPC